MISNEDVKKIVDDCKNGGFTIKVRDISYALLTFFFDDPRMAYKSVYTDDPKDDREMNEYFNSSSISYLSAYLKSNYVGKSVAKSKGKKIRGENEMSFDENKAAMIKLIDETQQAMDNGEVDKKDGLKIIADLRVKLNDRFNVKDDTQDSLVVVENKFNAICPYCNREVSIEIKK